MTLFSKLSLALAAITLIIPTVGTALSRDDIAKVQQLIAAEDLDALLLYLRENPQLLDGTPLGQELRNFYTANSQRLGEGTLPLLAFSGPSLSELRAVVSSSSY